MKPLRHRSRISRHEIRRLDLVVRQNLLCGRRPMNRSGVLRCGLLSVILVVIFRDRSWCRALQRYVLVAEEPRDLTIVLQLKGRSTSPVALRNDDPGDVGTMTAVPRIRHHRRRRAILSDQKRADSRENELDFDRSLTLHHQLLPSTTSLDAMSSS